MNRRRRHRRNPPARGRHHVLLLSHDLDDRGGGGWRPAAGDLPAGAGRRAHGRRVRARHQRQAGRRVRHAIRPGGGERVRRRRLGVFRFDTDPAAAARPFAGASAGVSAVQFGPQLCLGHQVGRNRHAAGANAGCDATGVQCAAQWPAGAGDGGTAARRRRPRYPRQRGRVSRRPSGALRARSHATWRMRRSCWWRRRAPSSWPGRACCMPKPATNWCGSPSCCRRLS